MMIEALLEQKANMIKPERCQIDVIVPLTHGNFEYLINCTLDDYEFIKEALDKLSATDDDIHHCIMAIDEETQDGILIDPQGYSYPRYTAFIPNAGMMLEAEEYPSLTNYTKAMRGIAETVTQLALNSHSDGEYMSDLEYIETEFQPNILDKYLLVDMLNERPEFKDVEYDNGALVMKLNDSYITDSRLSAKQIQEMCARHKLWQLGVDGGERADFSGKTVDGYDFVGMDLNDAELSDARFINCNFTGAFLDSVSAVNAYFEKCTFDHTGINSVNYSGAEIVSSNFVSATFWNCEMTNAVFRDCDLCDAEFINCRLVDTDFDETNTKMVNYRDCTEEPESMDQSEDGGSFISM